MKPPCKKTVNKIIVLARISSYFSLDQKLLLNDSVIKSWSRYCPLIQMFCSCSLNNTLNHIEKRVLVLVYEDYVQSFQDTPEIINENSKPQESFECLAKEISKRLNDLHQPITNYILKVKDNHDDPLQ